MANIQYEELEYCKIKVSYMADPEVVNKTRDEAIKVLKKGKVKVPGFRPGKATAIAIKKHCKDWIEKWVTKEMVSTAYEDVLFETKWKPIGFPQVLGSNLIDSSFTSEMIFLKKPDFELKEYKGFEIPKPHFQYTLSELAEKMIQDLRIRHGDVLPYEEDDFVQLGDQITLDFECKVNDKVFEPFTSEGMLYTVGSDLIPDFDNKLLGMKAGDERDFDIIFIDHPNEEIKDKRGKFHATVHMGTKTIPCPLDDTLAEKVGLKTYDELAQQVAGQANNQIKNIEVQQISQQVIRRLLNNHDFEVPSWLLLMESQRLAAQQNLEWKELSDDEKKVINTRSKDGIKLSMLLDSIRDEEPESNFSEEEIIKVLKLRVESTGQNGNEFIKRTQKDGSLLGIITQLKDEATIQWLISQSKIIE